MAPKESYENQKSEDLTTLSEVFSISAKHNRNYNVDVKPRLIFGDSGSVNMMCKASMDRYMDFKAVGDILYDLNSLISLPSTKGEIFAHKSIGLL